MTTTKDSTLGKRLGLIREQRGMSQADLARGSGVSQAQISLIEGGERLNPGVLTLNAIAAALNVDIRDLLETKPRRRSKRSA